MTDLRVIHAGLSVRSATAVQLALTGATDPLAVQFANYLADELREQSAPEVEAIRDRGPHSNGKPTTAKAVAEKMAKAAKAAA